MENGGKRGGNGVCMCVCWIVGGSGQSADPSNCCSLIVLFICWNADSLLIRTFSGTFPFAC